MSNFPSVIAINIMKKKSKGKKKRKNNGAVLEVSVMLILNQVQDDSFSIYAICIVEIPKQVRNDTAN